MNLHVPAIAAPYRITQRMWEDFLYNPVLAARILLGYEFDAFQRARLKVFWFHQEVCDSSGFSSGKTIVDWAFCALRCLLIPDQHVGVYYFTFDQMKETFWLYYRSCKSPWFHAQIGETDEKGDDVGTGKKQGAGTYKAIYKNGNTTTCPAPSFMKDAATQSSRRFNTIIFEEYTHIDARSDGIDKQLIGRGTMKSWNQHHPLWGNHLIFTAPAKTRMHPAYKRYAALKKRVDAGDPRCAVITFSYKDFSDLPNTITGNTFKKDYRVDATIDSLKSKNEAEFLGEGLGVWGASGTGWFTEEALLQCQAAGRVRHVTPVISRQQMELV